MFKVVPYKQPPDDCIEALQRAMAHMSTFKRAVYAHVSMSGEFESTPAVILETSDPTYRREADILAVTLRPFYKALPFIKIAPVPSGPWWDHLQGMAIPLRCCCSRLSLSRTNCMVRCIPDVFQ